MACSPLGCVTACVVYGRFDSKTNRTADSIQRKTIRRSLVWSLIFWPILNVKLCFVLDRLSVFVCKHKKTILSYRMGQKLSSKLLFIYLPNSDGFYIFIFHKVV